MYALAHQFFEIQKTPSQASQMEFISLHELNSASGIANLTIYGLLKNMEFRKWNIYQHYMIVEYF